MKVTEKSSMFKRPSLALEHRNASLVFDDGRKIQKWNETFKFEEIWRKERGKRNHQASITGA